MQSPTWAKNLAMTSTLVSDIKDKTLPTVSFVMPDSDRVSDEPPASLAMGQTWVRGTVNSLNSSGYLNNTIVLLTWDDSGGWFDHVQPPGDFGYRVPMIMLAPYGPEGVVDHQVSSFYSIPTTIESLFGLSCMHQDCGAYNLPDALLGGLSPASESVSSSPIHSTIAAHSTTSTVCQAWATAYWGPAYGCEDLSATASHVSTASIAACQAWATAYWGPRWGCEHLT